MEFLHSVETAHCEASIFMTVRTNLDMQNKTALYLTHVIAIDPKSSCSSDDRAPVVMERTPSGNHGLERAQAIKPLFYGFGRFTWTQISPPAWRWTSHENRGKSRNRRHRKQMPTPTARRAAEEDQLRLLGFHQSLSGKKICLCSLTAPRGLFVNVTLVKLSATVYSANAAFSPETEKSSGCILQHNRLISFFMFYFWDAFFWSSSKTKMKLETAVQFFYEILIKVNEDSSNDTRAQMSTDEHRCYKNLAAARRRTGSI